MKKLNPKFVPHFVIARFVLFITFISLFYTPFHIIAVSDDFMIRSGSSATILEFLFWSLFTITVVYTITIAIYARLAYRYYRYELKEDIFRKEYGVIYKKHVTIPYGRIQNIDIYQGVLERMFGLSTLHIHTAGVGGVAVGEGRLPGLSKNVAEALREELIQKARACRTGQGL